MKIININIDWMLNWSNEPDLKVLVDKLPDLTNLRYEQSESCYFAELDGYVDFKHYDRPGQGYGGRTFHITLTDGTKKDLIGPWSSRASVMNMLGFTPCTEVAITDDPAVFKRGHMFYGAAITIALLEPALTAQHPEVKLVRLVRDNEPRYVVHSVEGCYKTDHGKALYDCPVCGRTTRKLSA